MPAVTPTAPSQLRMVLALQTTSPAVAVEDATPRVVVDALAQPTVMTVTPSTLEGEYTCNLHSELEANMESVTPLSRLLTDGVVRPVRPSSTTRRPVRLLPRVTRRSP